MLCSSSAGHIAVPVRTGRAGCWLSRRMRAPPSCLPVRRAEARGQGMLRPRPAFTWLVSASYERKTMYAKPQKLTVRLIVKLAEPWTRA